VLGGVKIDGALRMANGSLKLRANALSTSGTIRSFAYRDLIADVRANDGRIVFSPITGNAFGGSMRGEGVYDVRDPKRPSLNFDTSFSNIRVNAFVAALGGPQAAVVDGVADAQLSLAGSGSEWSTVIASLAGGGNVEIRDGALRDTNLVRALLTNLSGLPGLSDMLPSDLRQKFLALFGGEDTPFTRLAARISIADGRMSSDDLVVEAPDFSAKGRGFVGFDRSMDVRAAIQLSEILSNELVARAGVLQRVADNTRRIVVPVRVEGTLPDVQARPDLDQVAHALQRGAVADFVEGILDRERLRIEHSAPPPPPPEEQPSKEKHPRRNADAQGGEAESPAPSARPPSDWYGKPAQPMPGTSFDSAAPPPAQ
jgi:uncharacterized protein involved in outer membrane biogenesis